MFCGLLKLKQWPMITFETAVNYIHSRSPVGQWRTSCSKNLVQQYLVAMVIVTDSSVQKTYVDVNEWIPFCHSALNL